MSNTLTTRRSRFEELWNQDKSKTASDFERQYKVALQQLSGSEKFKQMWNATPEPNGSTSFERNYNKALDATSPQRTFEEMWNESPDEFDRLWQEQQSTVKQQKTDSFRLWAGKQVNAAADALGSVNEQFEHAGFNPEFVFAPARQLAADNNKLGPLNVARTSITGAADLFDDLANAPLGMAQQAIGIQPEKRIRSDVAGYFEQYPALAEAKRTIPKTYEAYKTAGSFLTPFPVAGVAKNAARFIPAARGWAEGIQAGRALPKIADMAVTGAITGGTMSLGDQVKRNEQLDPLRALGGAALGGFIGGGIGTIGQVGAALGRAVKSQFSGVKTKPTQLPTQANEAPVPSLLNVRNEHLTDAEDLEALAMLQNRSTSAPSATALSAPTQPHEIASVPPLRRQRFKVGNSGRFTDVEYPSELESLLVSHVSRVRRMTSGRNPKPYPELEQVRNQIAHELGLPSNADVYPIAQKYASQVKELAKNAATETGGTLSAPSAKPKQTIRMPLSKAQEALAPSEPLMDFTPAGKPRTTMSLAEVQSNVIGERRTALSRDAEGNQILGRQRVGDLTNLEQYSEAVYPQALKDLTTRYAQAKVAADVYKKQLEQVANDLYKIFGNRKLGKYRLEDVPGKQRLNKAGDDFVSGQKADLNAQLPSYEEPLKADGARATLDESSIAQIGKVRIDPKITEQEAAALLEKHKQLADQAEKNQKAIRQQFASPDGDQLLIAQRRLRNETGDDFASLRSTIEVPGPDGKAYRVLVEAQEPRREMPLLWSQFERAEKQGVSSEEFFSGYAQAMGLSDSANALAARAKAGYDQLQAAIETALNDSTKSYAGRDQVAVRKALGLAVPIGLGLAANQPAQAADGKSQDSSSGGVVATTAMVAASIAVAKKFGPQVVRQFMKSPTAMLAHLYKDTYDHIQFLDSVLGKTGAESLFRQIQENNVGAMLASWGVKWDSQAQKAHAMSLLRDKVVKPADALAGQAGTVFADMNSRQREAVVTNYLNQKAMLTKVNQYKKEVDSALEAGLISRDSPHIDEAIGALDFVQQTLAPRMHPSNAVSKLGNTLLSSSMDFYFGLNPAHHLTNLTDSFITGGSRVGPLRIVKAWNMLGTDKEIQKIFADSNLVGSFRGEQIESAARLNQGNLKPKLTDSDFPSDRINANRVALASFLQYAEENSARLAKNGYQGDGKQFVKDLFGDKLDPTIAMDAFIHMSETASRTLGVDVYRLNTDVVSRWQHSPAVGVFVKQPARQARLIVSYLTQAFRERDVRAVGKLFTMFGYVGLFGGSGAISIEGKQLWQNMHPDSYFAVSAALDKYNPYSMITGENLSKKVEWSLIYPAMAVVNPGLEAAKKGGESFSNFWSALRTLAVLPNEDWQTLMTNPRYADKRKEIVKSFQAVMTTLGQTVMPRLPGGVPTGAVVRAMGATDKAVTGEQNINYYQQGSNFPYASRQEVSLDKAGIPRWASYTDMVIPGTPNWIHMNQQAKWEQKVRRQQGQRVPASQQAYQDPLMQLAL